MNEKQETVEAEVIEEKSLVLKPIKYPFSLVDLNSLLEEYKYIPDIDPESEEAGEQYQLVTKGHKAFVKARTSIEKVRKELKSPSIEYGKKVDEIAKEFQAMIAPTEKLLFDARNKVEQHEKNKIEEAERLEHERVTGLKNKIEHLKNAPLSCFSKSSIELQEIIDTLPSPSVEEFEEFYDEAFGMYSSALGQIRSLYDTKVKAEQAEALELERKQEQDRLDAEREAEMEAQRQEMEKQKQDLERQQSEMQETMRLQQEALDLQRAEMEQEEQQKQIQIDKENAEKEAAENLESLYNESCDDISSLIGIDNALISELIKSIIDGKIRNIKWSPDVK